MKIVVHILSVSFFCFLYSCKTPVAQSTIPDNIIRLSDAIENIQEVCLSDLADSISYIILETKNSCLLGGAPTFTFSPYFIFDRTYCIKMSMFAKLRNTEKMIPQIAFYDKSTGRTTAVKGKGLNDDIWGMDYFYPNCGAYIDKLFKSVWPFELYDFINECQSKGQKVHPKLLELANKIKPDDNPVLLVAHLKK